ncbi:MAG: hypothetical protein ACNA78_04835 [Balneolaceae bacterium]
MHYPIFKSIVNKIDDTLALRNINVKNFKTWSEPKINATGLSIIIDLSSSTHHLDTLSIHFDWDRFREAACARQMEGTSHHPVLKTKTFGKTSVDPFIDVEMNWSFDVEQCQPSSSNGDADFRIRTASEWMEKASRKVNEILADDDIITRWHLEIDGDKEGKYLTSINLISYYQFSLAGLESLQEVHRFTRRKLIHLLQQAKQVVRIVDQTVEVKAA